MEMLDQIVMLVSCIADIYICYYFYSGFFQKRDGMTSWRCLLVSLAFALILYLVNLGGSSVINLMMIPMSLLLYLLILFKGRFITKLMSYLVVLSILMGVEFLFAVISEKTIQSDGLDIGFLIVAIFIIKLLSFLVVLVIRQIAGNQTKRMVNKVFCLYLLLPITSISIMCVAFYLAIGVLQGPIVKIVLIVLFASMFFANIIVFAAFQSYAKELGESMHKEFIIEKEKANKQYYDKVSEVNDERKALIHDLKHYLSGLRGLITTRENEKAIAYLTKIDERLNSTELCIFSHVTLLDAILTEKKNSAEKANIQFDIHCDTAITLPECDENDYIAMLGNLLDNALRGASFCKSDRAVWVEIYEVNHGAFLTTKIVNTFDANSIRKKDGTFETTKNNKSEHGFGLKNVQKMINKHNGMFTTEIEDQKFTAILTLPLQ